LNPRYFSVMGQFAGARSIAPRKSQTGLCGAMLRAPENIKLTRRPFLCQKL
jgi:hypothetical protein